jgi:hypothetical protein
VGSWFAAIKRDRQERRYRAQYRASVKVLSTIPPGTRDEGLTHEQREAWRLHDEALKWLYAQGVIWG